VDPPRPDKAPSITIEQHGITTTVTGDPTKPAPTVHSEGNGAADDIINKANDIAQAPQKLADEAIKSIQNAATNAINGIVENVKKKVNDQIEQWKKDAKPYLYMAAGIFFLILLTPALIASFTTAWIVRCVNRKRTRKQELALEQAMVVVRAYAKDAGVKLAA